LLRLGVPWGLALATLVAAIWYGPVIARHGRVFVDEFFIQHHFARYVSNKYHHPQPFYFYLPVTLLMALPWTLFLFGGIAGVGQTNPRAEDAAGKLRVLGLAWLVVPVLFFSASGSKLPGYVLPAIPGAALLAGDCVHRYLRGTGGLILMRLTGALALMGCATFAAFKFFHVGTQDASMQGLSTAYTVALLLPSGFAGGAALFFARKRELCVVSIVGATLLTVALIVSGVLESAARQETLGQVFREAGAVGFGGLPVVSLHTVERTAEFYAAGRLAYDEKGEPLKLEGEVEVEEFARGKGGQALVIVPLQDEPQLFNAPGLEAKLIGDNGKVALVHVKTR
jgi:4-amino-4-deoxy-L-arabinose transferase-like glycosyltransferase